MKPAALFGALLFASTWVLADEAPQICAPAVLQSVGAYLDKADFRTASEGGDIVSAACKVWPYNGDTVFAFAYGVSEPPEFIRHFAVGTLAKASGQIRTFFHREIGEDAVLQFGDESLRIDTTPYQISKTSRALGVQIDSIGTRMGCTDGWIGSSLLLFTPDQEKLRFVFGVYTYVEHTLSGANCIGSSSAKYEFANVVIGVEDGGASGFADLVLTARISVEGWNDTDDQDYSVENRVEYQRMRHTANGYRAVGEPKWWLADFWNFAAD